jgi:5-methylcytosine-specific restriction enzyme A
VTRNTVCATPGCPELVEQGGSGYCPVHAPPPWAGMGHGARLGKSGWQRKRDNDRTMRRHHGICHVCGRPGADRIDHVINLASGGTDDEANRAPIHSVPCHQQKTQAEAAAGRRRRAGVTNVTPPDVPAAPRRRWRIASVPLDDDRYSESDARSDDHRDDHRDDRGGAS